MVIEFVLWCTTNTPKWSARARQKRGEMWKIAKFIVSLDIWSANNTLTIRNTVYCFNFVCFAIVATVMLLSHGVRLRNTYRKPIERTNDNNIARNIEEWGKRWHGHLIEWITLSLCSVINGLAFAFIVIRLHPQWK